MYLFLVDDSSEYKKAKGVNKNAVARISHNENMDVQLNNKFLMNSLNRIQKSKNHKIETYKINKVSLSWFYEKIYILDSEYDGLALGY